MAEKQTTFCVLHGGKTDYFLRLAAQSVLLDTLDRSTGKTVCQSLDFTRGICPQRPQHGGGVAKP